MNKISIPYHKLNQIFYYLHSLFLLTNNVLCLLLLFACNQQQLAYKCVGTIKHRHIMYYNIIYSVFLGIKKLLENWDEVWSLPCPIQYLIYCLIFTSFTHSISCMILLTYMQLLSASCLYSQFRHWNMKSNSQLITLNSQEKHKYYKNFAFEILQISKRPKCPPQLDKLYLLHKAKLCFLYPPSGTTCCYCNKNILVDEKSQLTASRYPTTTKHINLE